jgi:acetylornithine deacetylase
MHESGTRALLERLVGFPTVSRDSNLALIAFVQQHLAQAGVACELFHNAERSKASLWATIGPRERPGIVLSGHTDVVPTEGQAWTQDPFCLSERDGRLYGRGTADMKGFIAAVLAAVPALAAQPLRLPVHIALSYDEEVGCLGVRPMLAEIGQRLPLPKLCLIGEPTSMRPVLGHKGKLAMRCEVHGLACHSAYAPSGVNAIEYAAQLIARLGEIGERLARPAQHDARFDPAFSTVQTGTIAGGRALNIVPSECTFDFEVRALPGFDPQAVPQELQAYAERELLPRMQAVHPQAGIALQPLSAYPGLATASDSEAAALLAQLCGSADFGTVAYGSEGGLFLRAGIPTVICGPGSMDQGHKPDEYVTVAQLERCDAMLARLVAHARVQDAGASTTTSTSPAATTEEARP